MKQSMREIRPERETPENRRKRLKMRSGRRGMKEMDLILGAYAQARLADLPASTLDRYEALLDENDQDLLLAASPRLLSSIRPLVADRPSR